MSKEVKVLESKEELLRFRKELKTKGYTEANLVYRNGGYELTYLTGQVDLFGLMEIGFVKASKEFKEFKKKNKFFSKVA